MDRPHVQPLVGLQQGFGRLRPLLRRDLRRWPRGLHGKTDIRPVIWGPPRATMRRLFGPKHGREPLDWNAAAAQRGVRERVFCASMADVFEWHPLLEDARA